MRRWGLEAGVPARTLSKTAAQGDLVAAAMLLVPVRAGAWLQGARSGVSTRAGTKDVSTLSMAGLHVLQLQRLAGPQVMLMLMPCCREAVQGLEVRCDDCKLRTLAGAAVVGPGACAVRGGWVSACGWENQGCRADCRAGMATAGASSSSASSLSRMTSGSSSVPTRSYT